MRHINKTRAQVEFKKIRKYDDTSTEKICPLYPVLWQLVPDFAHVCNYSGYSEADQRSDQRTGGPGVNGFSGDTYRVLAL